MMNRWMMTTAAALLVASCGQPLESADVAPTEDGVVKPAGDKADAWNWRNNPAGFRTDLDYLFENLPAEGASNRVGWAASYWPYYEDGINARWQGSNVLSPAEKYDKAYNNWTEPDGFMDLEPWNSYTCEFDQEYYDALGPAASWTNRNKGTWRAHNGIDDDDDGVEDSEECSNDRSEYDGLETWWGICHAWAPAAIMEDEPLKAVEHNGVTFDVSDIKALLIQQYDRTNAYMVGGRCNDRELERDDTGRITNDECRDLNAGSWHVIVTNLLGKHSRPFVIERTTNYQVWNQPLVGYEVTEQREITLDEAHDLLQIENTGAAEGNGVFVRGIEEESPLAKAFIEFVNTATLEELDFTVGLYVTAAENLVAARPFATLQEIEDVPYVGASTFGTIEDYVQSEGLVQMPTTEYVYNDEATRFVEVRMTTDWVTESHPSTEPMTPQASRYMRHDYYHYILELNDDGEVIGGEWLGSSNTNHPDFVWLPVSTRGGNPNISLDEVRALVAKSRADEDGGDDGDGGTDLGRRTYPMSDLVEIPDNDPRGAGSTVSVSDSGTIGRVLVDLEIEHTYRGDLIVQLVHGGVATTVFDGSAEGNGWEDDVSLTGVEVEGFLGAELSGDWELRIVDTMGADVGRLVEWTLSVETN